MIERHDNESTSVFRGDDDPRKPWSFCCECGAFSIHTTERAANRARTRHMNDESLFIEQVRVAEGRVALELQALHSRLNEANEARVVYQRFLDNRS